ncbi:MAG: hypothetical protein U1E36_04235 [Rickettsiales bacterium]
MNSVAHPFGTRNVHIWDNPESRIRFLETVLGGKDWEAVVHADPAYPHSTGLQNLNRISEELTRHGFTTRLASDEHGQPILHIHHLGDEIGLLASVHELGLVDGARRTLFHLDQPFGNAMKHTRDFLMNVTENPAKALGGLYMVSDIFQIFSEAHYDAREAKAHGHRTSVPREAFKHYANLFNGKELEKSLMSFAGLMTTFNSMILLFCAQDGREEQLKSLNKQMHKAIADGVDPLHPDVWKDPTPEHGMIAGISRFLRRHPIESAAMSQIIGQVGQFASGGMRYRTAKKTMNVKLQSEGFNNMGRAATSALSWTIFMMPNKNIEHKDPDLMSPHRWVQEFQDNPQRFSALLSAGASLFGVRASMQGGKTLQKYSEMSYLLGDATMLFVNKSHYGVEGAAAQEALGKAAATFIITAPLVFGEESEKQFVSSLGRYLAARSIEQNMAKNVLGVDARTIETAKAEMVESLAPQISQAIFKELAGKSDKLEKIAHSVAQILLLFPEESRDKTRTAIAEATATMPGVYVEADEMCKLVRIEEQKLAAAGSIEKPQKSPSAPLLAKAFSDLVFSLPGLGSAENALKLYDAITPTIRTSAQDISVLDHALNQQAARDIGIPAHAIPRQPAEITR